jgi:hypothetical protein
MDPNVVHPGANLPVHRPGDPGPPVPEEVIVKHLRDAGYEAGVRFGAAGMARLEKAQRPDFAVWLAEEIDPDEAGQICKAIFDRLGDLGVDVDRVEHKGGDDHRSFGPGRDKTCFCAHCRPTADELVELVGDGIPYHLRPDVPPLGRCNRCQRKTWSAKEIGREDRMAQPDGNPCGGRIVAVTT